jgi:hypothetical protein
MKLGELYTLRNMVGFEYEIEFIYGTEVNKQVIITFTRHMDGGSFIVNYKHKELNIRIGFNPDWQKELAYFLKIITNANTSIAPLRVSLQGLFVETDLDGNIFPESLINLQKSVYAKVQD